MEAMQKYKSLAIREEKARIYNVLLYYYFSSIPLTDKQLMKLFNIDRRTVYKDIDRGVKDLTVILYGIGGIELLPEEESPAFIKAKLQEAITKKLNEEFGRGENNVLSYCRVRNEEKLSTSKKQRRATAAARGKDSCSKKGSERHHMRCMDKLKNQKAGYSIQIGSP